MKKIFLTLTTVASLVTVQAHAQAKNFEGFSLGANVEFDSASTSATDGTSDTGNNTRLGLQAQYNWAPGQNFVLGLGVSTGTGSRQAGAYASGAGAYISNRYALDLVPAYAINKDLLLFGKVSSISASVAADDGASTASVQGLGYGIGIRAMVDRNIYWQAGYDSYKFNDATFGTGTTASLKGNVVSLGLGYKF